MPRRAPINRRSKRAHAGRSRPLPRAGKDIGGGPLGVSCFEDGTTCVTATSQILPAGYEVKRSLDGGKTWGTVPDADLFIFGLDNQAVFGNYAIVR